jgi:glutamate dehydrogenase/leucine dehydrogenase
MDLWSATPDAFIEALRGADLRRAYLVTDSHNGELKGSHPVMDSLLEALRSDSRDFRNHEGCFFEIGKESGHLLSAHVHLTRRGQAAGGVRFWSYPTMEAMTRDGLRLAVGMGQKCALAGLWWGGGKGVVARCEGKDHRDPELRAAVYRDYGHFMTGLRGCYVTAEDVGTTTEDMAWIFSQTRHTTCIPESLGGSGNPSDPTAGGVVVAMEAALEHLGLGTLEGKTIAMQGLGNVSTYMLQILLDHGVKQIIGAEIDPLALDRLRPRFEAMPLELRQVDPGDNSILAEACDILAPNAVGAILNPSTIPTIKAKVVCGAANNQLEESERDSQALKEQGILYVPDFLANRMGIVNCANEQYGSFDEDPAILVHLGRKSPAGIFQRALEVFKRAQQSGRTTAHEAELLANELMQQLHPIWGHRGQVIIDHLVQDGWDRG